MLIKFYRSLHRSEFLKSVFVLLSGTLIAQFISYALTPIISRQFTPEEMGQFGIYQRWLVLIATIATARYEFSLPLPKKDEHSFLIYRLALFTSFITILLTIISTFLFGLLSAKPLDYYLWIGLLILGVASTAFFSIGTNWAIRNKQFNLITSSKIYNSLVMNFSRVGFGFLKFGKWGLIASFLLAVIVSSLNFSKSFFQARKKLNTSASKKKMFVLARKYKDFPLVNLPHALSDNIRDLLIALIISDFFSERIFGSFDFTFRMLRLPVMLIGVSLSQVLFNRIADFKRNGSYLFPIVKKVFLLLVGISILPFTIIYFFGEPIFIYVFGQNWSESGKLSELMAPWLMFNFLISPLSVIPLVLEKQRGFFALALISSVTQILGFLFLPYLFTNSREGTYQVFHVVSISQVLFSSLVLVYIFRIIKNEDRKNNSNPKIIT